MPAVGALHLGTAERKYTMSKEFKVGDRVAKDFNRYNSEEDDTIRGEVVGFNPKNGKLLVEQENWRGTEVKEWDPATTLSEAEANEKLSKMEEEYNAVAAQVAEKVAAAAALLNEASSIADKKGFDLQSMYEEVRPLMRALDNAGWSTSSMSC